MVVTEVTYNYDQSLAHGAGVALVWEMTVWAAPWHWMLGPGHECGQTQDQAVLPCSSSSIQPVIPK